MARKLLWRDGQVSGKLRSSLFFYTYISNGRSLAPPLGRKMKVIPSLSVFWKLWSCGEKRSFHHFRPNNDHYCHFSLISRAGFPVCVPSATVSCLKEWRPKLNTLQLILSLIPQHRQCTTWHTEAYLTSEARVLCHLSLSTGSALRDTRKHISRQKPECFVPFLPLYRFPRPLTGNEERGLQGLSRVAKWKSHYECYCRLYVLHFASQHVLNLLDTQLHRSIIHWNRQATGVWTEGT
jgi:hypothetical protein